MNLKNPLLYFSFLVLFVLACKQQDSSVGKKSENPFLLGLNIPVDYAKVSSKDLDEYTLLTINNVIAIGSSVKEQPSASFENVFTAIDDINNKINKAYNNCFMLFWVSPDSLIRAKGLAGYQLLDSLSISIRSDKGIFDRMVSFKSSDAYTKLTGNRKALVDDMILNFERSGVNLDEKQLLKFKLLTKEINQLSADYSTNMNSSDESLVLDDKGVKGLPEEFKSKYKVGEGKYKIPIINATRETVMNNAESEVTRKGYYFKFYNRASDKNLTVLDSLVKKRHELARVMGYSSYAAYSLVPRMAKKPQTVWAFIGDLVSRSREKAKTDVEILENLKKEEPEYQKEDVQLQAWDISFYKNQLLRKQYDVDGEKLREYLPMEQCLKGMFDIYQELLGLEFRKVKNPSVWHKEVDMYEVYEGQKLKGRFYLDLYPRPNKETWFYGVNLTSGRATEDGYEVPVSMLLGNFTRASNTLPSLLSLRELNTLFHEFGHIVNMMSYHGEFSSQSNSKEDFGEAMSQLFENWLWDYDILSSFARHYKTGETFPKAMFDKMVKAKNVSSGLSTILSLQRSLYDMNLYDKYNAENPISTDKLWKELDRQLDVMPFYVEGTHLQASWIHINTHPVYFYGYSWSQVYAQDMFTQFEKNGLKDVKTGMRYRELILANGTQRDIVEAVEEFLGRKSNHSAFIKNLGLE